MAATGPRSGSQPFCLITLIFPLRHLSSEQKLALVMLLLSARDLFHHLFSARHHNLPLKTHSPNKLADALPGQRHSLYNFSCWSRCLLTDWEVFRLKSVQHCLLYIFHILSLLYTEEQRIEKKSEQKATFC